MKKNYTILLFLSVLFGFFSCNDDTKEFDNHVYISVKDVSVGILLESDDAVSKTFQINMLKTESEDVNITLAANASKVADYNYAYSTTGSMLSSDYFSITPAETQIVAGNVASVPITVNFVKLTELNKDSIYILPITLTSTVNVLDSKSTIYYAIKGGNLINVVANMNEDASSNKNSAYVDWTDSSDFAEMTQFTAEILLYPNALDNFISTVFGIEGGFLLRFGDAGLASNQLQIATSNGNHTSSNLVFSVGKWTHLALTFDAPNNQIKVYVNGVLKETFETGGLEYVDWSAPFSDESDGQPRCFRFGYSYDASRNFNGYMSECRVWNKVLTADDLNEKDHFYYVDPTSDGLIAYWKFNDGAGNTIKDYSAKGNNATAMYDMQWVNVELP